MAWILVGGACLRGDPAAIPFTLAWDEPALQSQSFEVVGYRVFWSLNGGEEHPVFLDKSSCSNGVGVLRFTNGVPSSTYRFRIQTAGRRTDDPSVYVNSELLGPLIYQTGGATAGDQDPPDLEVSPLPETVSSASWLLSGFVHDSSHMYLSLGGSVKVSDLRYSGAGGYWSASLKFTQAGSNWVNVVARDLFGNQTVRTLSCRWAPEESAAQLPYATILDLQSTDPPVTTRVWTRIPGATWFALLRRDPRGGDWAVRCVDYADQGGVRQLQFTDLATNSWVYRVTTNLVEAGIMPLAEGQSVEGAVDWAKPSDYYAFYAPDQATATWVDVRHETPGLQLHALPGTLGAGTLADAVNPSTLVDQQNPYRQALVVSTNSTTWARASATVLAVARGTADGASAYTLTLLTRTGLVAIARHQGRDYGAANVGSTGMLLGAAPADGIQAAFTVPASASSPVGDYPITPVLSDPKGRLTNYSVTLVPGVLSVLPAPMRVKAADATRLYGSPNPPFEATFDGFVKGEGTDQLQGSPEFTTGANETSPVGAYMVAPSQGSLYAKNYRFEFVAGQLTVSRAPLTVTLGSSSRPYGAPNPPVDAILAGLRNNDPIRGEALHSAGSGVSPGLYPIGARLSDPAGRLDNYWVITNTGVLTVTPAPLALYIDSKSRAYGATNPELTGRWVGVTNGDPLSVSFICEAAPGSLVGKYAIQPRWVDPLGRLGNYALTVNPANLTVRPALLTVSADSLSRGYGESNPPFQATIVGWVNGESASILEGRPGFNAEVSAVSPVGVYTVTPTLGTLSAPNYTFAGFVKGLLTVTQVLLTATADSKERAYGSANPAFTGRLTGVRNGDNLALAFDCSATPASSPGRYAIRPRVLDPDRKISNYFLELREGVLLVTALQQTLWSGPVQLRLSPWALQWGEIAPGAYRLDASVDLLTWEPLLTTNLTDASWTWSDPSAALLPRRFYRLLGVGTTSQ